MPAPQITPLNIGYLRADLSEWYRLPSGHPYAGQVDELPILCYHIALAARSVLVDAAAYEFPEEVAKMAIPGFHAPSLLEQLTAAKIDAAEVSEVIITHAHFDHFNALTRLVDDCYLPTFPNARHYLGAGDWQPEHFGALEERTLKVVHQHGLLTLVEGPLDLGDGLTILPAPGETFGHQILHVQTGRTEAYFAGDLYHHQLEFSEAARNVSWAAPEAMLASKAALMERAANSGALVFFAHVEGPHQVELAGAGCIVHWRAAYYAKLPKKQRLMSLLRAILYEDHYYE